MTKEEWLRVKREPEIPLGVWFSYYKERGGTYDDPIFFEQAFNQAMIQEPIIVYQGSERMRQVTRESARYCLMSYYDSIFNV